MLNFQDSGVAKAWPSRASAQPITQVNDVIGYPTLLVLKNMDEARSGKDMIRQIKCVLWSDILLWWLKI